MILDPTSLMKTLDNINEHILFGESIPSREGLEAARWIATLQGKKGHYRYMFAPTSADFEQGMRLFTGERLVCASARHIMGQEAARAAWLLGNENPEVRDAYQKATVWMNEEPGFQQSGTYCCGRCTLAYWRHTWVGGTTGKETHIIKGLKVMKDSRNLEGEWHRFPFFYGVYALLDLELEAAYAELKFARPAIEKHLKHIREGTYSKRRVAIFEKTLQKIS